MATTGAESSKNSLGNTTKNFFKEMKSQSISKLMSPNNYNSNNESFFAPDLNNSYNVASVKQHSTSF